MAELTLTNIVLCTVIRTESESELETLIESIRSVSKPSTLYNEDIYISDEELPETTIVYSNDETELPDRGDDYTAISVDVTDDDDVHIHSYIEADHRETVLAAHQQMLTSGNEFDTAFIAPGFEYDVAYEEVIDSIEFIEMSDDEVDLDVLNFVHNGFDITLLSYPTETTISVVDPDIESPKPSALEDRVQETIDRSEAYLMEELL